MNDNTKIAAIDREIARLYAAIEEYAATRAILIQKHSHTVAALKDGVEEYRAMNAMFEYVFRNASANPSTQERQSIK